MLEKLELEELVSVLKQRGFVYQSSEIYGGLAGFWDFGPLGIQLKKNIEALWWDTFIRSRDDIYGIETSIIMNPKVWEASGHTGAGFTDPLVEDLVNKKRYRADHLLEEHQIDPTGMTTEQMSSELKKLGISSPDGNPLSEVRKFNMMFETQVGATSTGDNLAFLRPETAQGMFVNFKNIIDGYQPNLPFGIAQIGRCFRNEISPRDFIFRSREFDIMEIEYFLNPKDWEKIFKDWQEMILNFFDKIGIDLKSVYAREIAPEDRAHYSLRTVDYEFDFPFGRKELSGLAYRTDHDLKGHQNQSKQSLEYIDKFTQEKILPHCIEPTWGVGRVWLAVICSNLHKETWEENGELQSRLVLKLPNQLAPYKFAVSPLLRNKPELTEKAREVYKNLKAKYLDVVYDDSGNIGKRYRKQDEIGTPKCIVIDFQTLKDNTVTIRDRDTRLQERIVINQI